MSDKREDYISWNEYFMGVALLAAERSKDPSTQVGACIVDENNRILSTGYNGFPHGCSDDDFPWNTSTTAKRALLCMVNWDFRPDMSLRFV